MQVTDGVCLFVSSESNILRFLRHKRLNNLLHFKENLILLRFLSKFVNSYLSDTNKNGPVSYIINCRGLYCLSVIICKGL